MRIGIYNANLHTMGGGEKYICVVAEFLSRTHNVEFITKKSFDKKLIEEKLHLDLSNIKINSYSDLNESNLGEYIKPYDYFINSSYMSGYVSPTKNSALIIFFPSFLKHKLPIWFYQLKFDLLNLIFKDPTLPHKPSNKIKKVLLRHYYYANNFFHSRKYIQSYGKVISISIYSQAWTKKELGADSDILYPPVDVDQFKAGVKQNIITSVGRFFVGNHSKKQLEMIKTFKNMCTNNPEIKDYEFHVCGGVGTDSENLNYLNQCKKEAEGFPIFFHENISYPDLKELYAKSKIFWHATGLNQDINKEPDKFEHFGITTVEAMSAGVVPVVIGKAGQVEIVDNAKTGFLWNTTTELIQSTLKVINDSQLCSELSLNAINASQRFSKDQMYNRISELFGDLDN